MGRSTYCASGLDNGHATCRDARANERPVGVNCECECHTKTTKKTEGEPPMTTLAELNRTDRPPAEPSTNGSPKKRTRRTFSEQQKRAIAAEYANAPTGTAHTVLERHQVVRSLVAGWIGKYGISGAKPGTPPSSEEKPARARTSAKEPAVSDVDEEEVEVETAQLAIDCTPDELEVLAAVAFLQDVGGPADLLAHLATELIEASAGESDVQLVLTARRARAKELAE